MNPLEVSNVSKRFGGLQAVDGMSFAVAAGEMLGLIGPNGSGKSTTLSLLMGVLKPDTGKVKCGGVEVGGHKPHVVAKHGMAMLFQHSRPLGRQTVLENIELALLRDSVFQLRRRPETRERARAAAARVGLEDVLDRLPSELAFAAIRRMELAKVIALEPSVVLLDEPFAGLAPAETREFAELAAALREQGRAVVLVDHNVKAVAGLVDRIIAMNAGRKIAEGSPEEVTHDAEVRRVYFGHSLDQTTAAEPVHARSEAGTQSPLLAVELKSVRYGQAEALRDVRFEIRPGEFIAVVGINGAGKTTLLKSIMDFVAYDGDIRWDGASLRGRKPASIARDGIALCPETRELFPFMSIRENLELGGHLLDRHALRTQLEWVFGLFPRLRERAGQRAHTLSGGERQMLTIGRALMQKPRLLMLDEPTLGLAPLVLEDISTVLFKLQKDSGLTVLLAEQNLTFALKHADRIHLLETGSVRWEGPANRFMEEVGTEIL
ncbi:MAG TPA: ATP-binding cassette domain-containing protein [Nevskiaceae bacterium]